MKLENFQIFFLIILCAFFTFIVNAPPKEECSSSSSKKVSEFDKWVTRCDREAHLNELKWDPKQWDIPYDTKRVKLDFKLQELKNNQKAQDMENFKPIPGELSKKKSKEKIKRIDGKQKRLIEVTNKKYVFEQSFAAMKDLSVSEWLNLKIHLKIEPEKSNWSCSWKEQAWYFLMLNDMFNNRRGLYYSERGDGVTINPSSDTEVKDYLEKFRFAGKIIAFGILNGLTPDSVHLGRVFLKTMLGMKIELDDVALVDEDFYKDYLMDVKKNPTAKKRFFTFGRKELIKNGEKIPVKETNVDDYIRLVIKYKYYKSVELQLDAFLVGFNSIIPLGLLKYFRPSDLEILLYPIPDHLNIEDWRAKTKVHYSEHPDAELVTTWFWEGLKTFGKSEKVKLLYFITGTTRYHMTSTGELVLNPFFEIYVDLDANGQSLGMKNKNSLPTADIKRRRLYLPWYDTSNKLWKRLLEAIKSSEPSPHKK